MKFKISSKLKKVDNLIAGFPKQYHSFLLAFFAVGVMSDLFLFKTNFDLRLFILIGLWLFIVKVYRLKSDSTFKLALVFLILLFIFFIFDYESFTTERIAVWIYLILAVGVIQQLFEIKEKKERE